MFPRFGNTEDSAKLSPMPDILLSTLNAKYIHSSLGLRYLYANLGELKGSAEIHEFVISTRPTDMAETILKASPRILGLGVYIWNISQTTELVRILKTVSPELIVVLGGPEISYEQQNSELFALSDYTLTGQADLQFAGLCREILNGNKPEQKLIQCRPFALDDLELPYKYYSEDDIANRVIYVESSRGCPYKCEFCLSSLDKSVWRFDLDRILRELEQLHRRGVRRFKFVDRTFNLKVAHSSRILQFFLDHMSEDLFVHFELIPDNLPEDLKTLITQFPPQALQFEIGVQSFTPEVQALISRKQNTPKSMENLRWLRQQSSVHIHADLIIGLPGESIESFARGLNQLAELRPHEIQIGILKRLKGSPIIRHTQQFDMRYNPNPPYNLLSNKHIDFQQMQTLSRFARYWDMIINSGRFKHTSRLLMEQDCFARFMALTQWLYNNTGQTSQIALARLFKLLFNGLSALGYEQTEINAKLLADFEISGIKGQAPFLKTQDKTTTKAARFRQARH